MKKNIYLFALLYFIFANLFAQSQYELYVAFDEKIQNAAPQNLKQKLIEIEPEAVQIFSEFDFYFTKAITISEDKLIYLSNQVKKLNDSDKSIQNLKRIFKVKSNLDATELIALMNKIEKWNSVRYCDLISNIPVAPPSDIAPTTPDFTPNQTYINANPGVNMAYAWNLGYNGQNIRFRDVEYGFNKNHEEFNDINISIATGMTVNASCSTDYTEHGTATLGQVFAHNGTYGITGLAHGLTEVIVYPEWTEENGYNRWYAVNQAINNSVTGDIIMFEMQAYGAVGNSHDFVPAEYVNSIWDLTKAATDAGIIIVAAAGNGNQNLDSANYADYISRGNSGAIIVGAGTANIEHNRLGFSTYGNRVDVQGWGESVYTTGYSTLSSLNNDFNQTYTSGFSGTSSATPIVASCATVLQSYYYDLTNLFLTPLELKNILVTTGIYQGTGVSGHIGPLPDMQSAMNYIDTMLSLENVESTNIKIFPNPAQDKIYIIQNELVDMKEIKIFNALGICVLQSEQQNAIDISFLEDGIYFITFNQNFTSKKIKFIKN
jgi:hypothetical protein